MNDKVLLSWFGPINFILACLVVFIHTYNASAYHLVYDGGLNTAVLCVEDLISQDFAHVAVPIFFAISGYLFFRNVSFTNLSEKLSRRIHSLVIPYIVWNAIYVVLFLILANIPIISENLNSIQNIDVDLRYFVKGVFFYGSNYIMWFVYQLLIYVFVLSPVLLLVLKNKYLTVCTILLWATVYSRGYLEIPQLSNTTVAVGCYPDMLCYFLLGGFLAKYKPFLPQKKMNMCMAIALFAVAQALWVINRGGYKSWNHNYLNILFCGISILSVFFFIVSRNHEAPKQWFYKYSFFIFTIHPFLLECIQKLFYILLPTNCATAGIDYIVSPILTIIICVLIAHLLQEKATGIYKLLGGR